MGEVTGVDRGIQNIRGWGREKREMAEKECHDIRHKLEREVGVVTGVDPGI